MPEKRSRSIAGGGGGATEAARFTTMPREATSMGLIARLLEDERVLGFLLLVPTVILLGLFIAYPFVKGVWLSLTSATVGDPGRFLGLSNYVKIWNDSIFQRAVYNTFVYTAIATVGKLTLGMWLAVLLNRHFRGKRLARASVIIVNIWRGMPFYAITLLAGLQTVNPELHEAAALDGATAWQRFWRITWPLLLPVTMVVTLFSVIQTFAEF